MKRILILSSLFAISFTASAAMRGEMAAREIAYNHFCSAANAKARKVASKAELSLAGTATTILSSEAAAKSRSSRMAFEPFYIYNNGDAAFVIVSGDDAVEPILAYGNEGAFVVDNIPEQVRGWLQTYADEMNYVVSNSSRHVFENTARRKVSAYPQYVEPILMSNGEAIQWDQNDPFNKECPSYAGYVCPTGCVATAFAQIMYYHRWPEHGQGGTKTYISSPYNLSQSFNFSNATFDYSKMLPRYYYGKYSAEQGEEVAKLCHSIGVAVEMQYDIGGSGTYSLICGDALVKYFNYDKNIHYAYRDYFTQDEWIDMIKKELSEGRPICYAGSSTSIGHQFVFDGYDSSNRVHVNWGWAGMSDGYFALTVLSPSSTGTGGGSVTSGGFIYNQAMWLGIQKPTEASTPVSHMAMNYYDFYSDGYTDGCLQIDKKNAIVGESITLTTKEISNMSIAFNGVFGMVIEDEAGKQIVLNTSSPVSIKCSAINRDEDVISQTGVIPADLADGNYTLYLASKADAESSWSRVRAAEGYCDYYEMTVADGKVEFSYNGNLDADGTLVADHAIYTKCRSQFTAKLKNNNKREFFGVAHVGVYTENADGTPNLVALCGKEQIVLPYGNEVEVVFKGAIEAASSGTTVNAGDYKACVIVENQGKFYQVSETIDITVKRIPSGMASLSCNDFTLTKTSYGIDEKVEGHLKVTNTQSVYSNFLGIIIFKGNTNYGQPYWEKEVFLEKGNSAEYSFSIPPQFEPGTYKASLRYTGGMEYSNEISSFTFDVRDEFVGINSMEGKIDVRSEEFYSLSGQKLSQRPLRGAYIVKQQTADGVKVKKEMSK